MNRKRLALVLGIPIVIVVLAVGLTRGNETNRDASPSSTTLPAVTGEDATADATLQPVDEGIDVEAGSDCFATASGEDASCQAYQVGDAEVAWLVEERDGAPVASFLRRESPTAWTRILRADGDDGEFGRVVVRVEDLSADGGVEAIFGFHRDDGLVLDVVAAPGEVVLHVDLGSGQAVVANGTLTTYLPEGAQWRRQDLKLVSGEIQVVASEVVAEPADGNV